MAYSSNMLAHRGPVVNFSTINTVTESTTILVRLEPDTVTLDIPFNRVTTWKRLIQTLFNIYMRNNPGSSHLTFEDALDNIKITNDRTGGIILPELWPDFIKPQVRVAAEFNEPFLCPPWFPKIDAEIKREEDDVEMMEAGVITCSLEPKIGGYVETADWRQPTRLLGPPPSKTDDIEPFTFLPTSTSTVPASSFTFTSTSLNSWPSMEPEKPRLRLRAGMNGIPVVSDVFAETVSARRSVSQEPTVESMVEGSASPPSVRFRNPFPQSAVSASSPSASTVFPQRFAPVRHIPASDSNSRTPTQSPECSSRPARDANPRPAKRKRDDDGIGSSPMDACMEPPRKSRSPFHSSGSNGGTSRAQSLETESSNQARRVSNPAPRPRAGDIAPTTTMVIHRKLLLLDSIGAGEMVKIVETRDGDLIVIRDDEEPEELMARRESNASMASTSKPKEKEIGTTKTGKKRGHGEANTEELVRIWSGGGPEPPAKRAKPKQYDKLTVEQRVKITKFVKEQHIIRIDHFTNPVIQEWKARCIPEADAKQTEEYLEEIASNTYKESSDKKEAYRLFMEHHNHSHKSFDARSSISTKA
ncbi:hypothetical protein TWF225_008384 [Orbilia oligospora]|uniref:Uncharacterized protein n=1 Tax=Orbilia oligospora TaxID=2813651 RepID=A0A7C8KAK1_ORBOL|nr:hypothetical protein TWF751_007454 [Orbilia oligospora]KAF3177396.1 hypothetical protein TWF225_008384 [Orbilia oligospora]KAF3264987.1 hypothetical protein TWF217_002641 [Orbilia oligospora]KAF3268227.1 hypothetical protein TWF128_008228 [Orbilia oligospora]TGJ68337.1 hypothetical protein EYR41_007392 [Orbilia oligospora]